MPRRADLTRELKWGLVSVLLLTCGAGCGDNIAGTTIEITSPERGAIISSDEVTVRGTAIGRVTRRVAVNGTTTSVADDGSFEVTVSLEPGTNIIETTAFGLLGDNAVDRRAVSSGELSAAPADGLLLHYGVRGLTDVAAEIKPQLDMGPIYTAIMAAPIKDSGGDVVTVSSISAPVDRFFMYSIASGLGGEVLFLNLDLAADADYLDSGGVAQSGSFEFDTLELHWTYRLDVTLSGDKSSVDVALVDTDTLYDHELLYNNIDIEPAVFDRVATDIHVPLDAALVAETTPQIEEDTRAWFEALNRTRDIALATGTLVQRNQLSEVVATGGTGLLITVSTQLGDGVESTFVPTPAVAEIPRGSDAGVAIPDDAVNQALGAMWRAGGFDVTLPSGAVMTLALPPSLRAVDGAPPELIVGDWIARAGELEVALSGSVLLAADDDEVELRLRGESASLVTQVISKGRAASEAESIGDEASEALVSLVSECLRAVSMPAAAAAAAEVIATGKDGFVEISVDLSDARAP